MLDMKILFTEDQIAARVDALAAQIVADYPGGLVLAPVLTGGFVFGSDLARAISRHGGDARIDFVQLASYGAEQSSSGIVKLLKDFSHPVAGQHVLLVDDVLDSGRSLFFAKQLSLEKQVASVKTCVAVDKHTGRAEDIIADYAAFEAGPDDFLVGYGMDDAGMKRGLPFIGAV